MTCKLDSFRTNISNEYSNKNNNEIKTSINIVQNNISKEKFPDAGYKPVQPISDDFIIKDDIENFFNNSLKNPPQKSIKTLKILRNPSIDYLQEEFGYSKALLKLGSWILYSKKHHDITNESLNEMFYKLNYARLSNCREIIDKWINNIDQTELEMSQLLKETSKKFLTCCICSINKVSILYLPCGHFISCSKCHKNDSKHCQACGEIVDESYPIFI